MAPFPALLQTRNESSAWPRYELRRDQWFRLRISFICKFLGWMWCCFRVNRVVISVPNITVNSLLRPLCRPGMTPALRNQFKRDQWSRSRFSFKCIVVNNCPLSWFVVFAGCIEWWTSRIDWHFTQWMRRYKFFRSCYFNCCESLCSAWITCNSTTFRRFPCPTYLNFSRCRWSGCTSAVYAWAASI